MDDVRAGMIRLTCPSTDNEGLKVVTTTEWVRAASIVAMGQGRNRGTQRDPRPTTSVVLGSRLTFEVSETFEEVLALMERATLCP